MRMVQPLRSGTISTVAGASGGSCIPGNAANDEAPAIEVSQGTLRRPVGVAASRCVPYLVSDGYPRVRHVQLHFRPIAPQSAAKLDWRVLDCADVAGTEQNCTLLTWVNTRYV